MLLAMLKMFSLLHEITFLVLLWSFWTYSWFIFQKLSPKECNHTPAVEKQNIVFYHRVKSVRIRSFSGPYFSAFGPEKLGIRTLLTQCIVFWYYFLNSFVHVFWLWTQYTWTPWTYESAIEHKLEHTVLSQLETKNRVFRKLL